MASGKLSRRDFLRVAGMTAGAAVLAACGGSAPPAAPTQAPAQQQPEAKATSAPAPTQAPASSGPTTVRLLTTHGATMQPFIQKSLANFAQAHPEVKINHEDLTEGYYDRLNVMLASQTLPDVVNLRSFDMFDWYRLGNLHSVSEFLAVDNTVKPTDLVDAILKSCQFEGKLWGLPYDASVEVLYYNKDMFDKAGVKYPAKGWTRDDMLTAAQTLTKAGDTWGFASLPPYWGWQVEPWYLGNGAKVVNEARDQWTMVGPEAEDTLQFELDLVKKHKVAPDPTVKSDINLFVVGKGGMYVSGQWEIPGNREALKFNWDITPLPAGTKSAQPITHGGTYIMYAKTKVPEAAWKIQRWITAEKDWQSNVYGASGYSIPALKAVDEDSWLGPTKAGKPPANNRIVLDELAKAVPGFLVPNYQKIESIMHEELDKVFLGDSTVKVGLDTLKKRADAAIQEALKK